ncbi:MAG: beta-ketoacyl synthase N-terminal-like domain-containing protein [Campylobacterales bacterium]|nr:beta-ketoacyl synthase N-terminal-like domain-containing protein [Campylobacterales bacterium]
MNRVFVTASSLVCALGRTPAESVSAIFDGDIKKSKKQCDPRDTNIQKPYFAIDLPKPPRERFYEIIFSTVGALIESAPIEPDELADITLFLGSTSINLPIYEDNFVEGIPLFERLGYDVVARAIAEKFNIKADRYTINTACTSSINALMSAASMIKQGKIKKAVVVGLEVHNNLTVCGFETLQLLSRDSCRPFDADRDGIVLGEICSAVLLSDTRVSDDDFEYLGGANICDTSSVTGGDMSGEMAKICIQKALDNAKSSKDEIVCIKAHATGSVTNDIAEGRGIKAIFGDNYPVVCAFKPYIGHTLGGCGVGELALLMECAKRSTLPKTVGFENIDEEIGIAPITSDTPIKKGKFLLNHFGFGGNSTVVVVSNI